MSAGFGLTAGHGFRLRLHNIVKEGEGDALPAEINTLHPLPPSPLVLACQWVMAQERGLLHV